MNWINSVNHNNPSPAPTALTTILVLHAEANFSTTGLSSLALEVADYATHYFTYLLWCGGLSSSKFKHNHVYVPVFVDPEFLMDSENCCKNRMPSHTWKTVCKVSNWLMNWKFNKPNNWWLLFLQPPQKMIHSTKRQHFSYHWSYWTSSM